MWSVKEEDLIEEVCDMLISILESKSCKDQMFLLIFEPENAELLYALITDESYTSKLKEKILKVIKHVEVCFYTITCN